MPQQRLVDLARLLEPLTGVGTDGLEHAVTRGARRVVRDHERLGDQPRARVEHVPGLHPRDRAHGRARFGVVPAGEHAEPLEQRALQGIEHLVGPLDGAPQRLVAFRSAAPAAGEQVEALVETLVEARGDVGRRHQCDPRRRELERERDAVEAPADLADLRGVRRIDREPGLHGAGALLEQPRRRRRGHHVDRGRSLRGHVELAQRPRLFTGDAERLAARDQEVHARALGQQRIDHVAGLVEHVLAVVEDEEQPAGAERVAHRVERRQARTIGHLEGLEEQRVEVVAIVDGAQIALPDTAGIAAGAVGGDLQHEAALAHAAHAGDRHQTRGLHRLGDRLALALAPHERREASRQVARHRVEGPQRREVAAEVGRGQLVQVLRAGDVGQTVLPEVEQAGALGEEVAHQLRRHQREQHLAAVAGRHDPGRSVHPRSVVVVAAGHRVSRVQPHPDPQLARLLGPAFRGQHPLGGQRRLDPAQHGREHGVQTVAGGLHDHPAVGLHRVTQDGVVALERGAHRLGELFPQAGRPLEVGEEERHGSGRKIAHRLPALLSSRSALAGSILARWGPNGCTM